MNYINYKKNELRQLSMTDFRLKIPDLSGVEKTQAIVQWFTDCIKSNRYTNCLLPQKAEIAYVFGVSLGTIQNVFKTLEGRNLIFLKQRVGAIVRNENSKLVIKKQTSKTDIASDKIKEFIKNSDIKTGDKFISERKLSKILDLSLNSVRLSVNRLVEENILGIEGDSIVLKNKNFKTESITSTETLIEKVKNELRQYISKNYKMGEKLLPNKTLAERFNVSIKTINNAIKLLEQDGMLLSRRGTYGTIVTNPNMTSKFDSRPEMSIFASAQDTAFYHYEKVQNKIRKMIADDYAIGTKLPSIRQFSEQLDLSPNIIRRALNNLAKEGILRFARGRYGGTYVIDMPDVEEQTFRWLAVNPKYASITK